VRLQRTFDLIVNAAQILTNNYEPNFVTLNLVKDILLHVYKEYKNQAKQKAIDYILLTIQKIKILLPMSIVSLNYF